MFGLMLFALAVPLFGQTDGAQTDGDRIKAAMTRLSEEAEVFASNAARLVAEETLEHKGRKAPPRFRLRAGAAASEAPQISYKTRTVVSEYGFAAFRESAGEIREFRKVVSVDGRPVVAAEQARLALAANMTSDDDRARKQLLQDFEKHGLTGATTDMGQAILLFRRSALANFDIEYVGETDVEGVNMLVFRYKQKSGDGMRVYDDRALNRPMMAGELRLRSENLLPARVTFVAETVEHKRKVRHEAAVDYALSETHAMLVPREVRYIKSGEDGVLVENVARYTGFRKFQVDADIKFTPAEEETK